jgi:Fe-S-cluster containining protein
VGLIEVFPSDSVYGDGSLVVAVPEIDQFKQMRTRPDNRCIALKPDGLCAIYDRRPWICRQFQLGSECCEAFRGGKKTGHVCDPCRLFDKHEG